MARVLGITNVPPVILSQVNDENDNDEQMIIKGMVMIRTMMTVIKVFIITLVMVSELMKMTMMLENSFNWLSLNLRAIIRLPPLATATFTSSSDNPLSPH